MEFLIVFIVNSRTPRLFFSDFLVENKEPAVHIHVGKQDIVHEWIGSSGYDGNIDSVRCIWHEPMFEIMAITRKILEQLPFYSEILMHGAVICDGSFAHMITAPSGTGKTSRAKLFVEQKPERYILNGDKPIIRIEENRVIACGSPWKGKEGFGVNRECQLKTIFLLRRAEKTRIIPVSFAEAFDEISKQIFFSSNGSNVLKTLKLTKQFEGKVQLFYFYSPLSIDSVETAYQVANQY